MIYIDASRSLVTQKTGVEYYSYELIRQLVQDHPNEITLFTPHPIDLPVAQRVIPGRRLWTQGRLSWALSKDKTVTNLFIPSHVLPVVHPSNSVVTLHDVAFRYFPQSYTFWQRLYLDWSTRFALLHARSIVVPSAATKSDLVQFYNAGSEKIFVIPHGYAPHSLSADPLKTKEVMERYYLLSKKYFLYIGRIEAKKNLVLLIQAFKAFLKQDSSYRLVLAGKPGTRVQEVYDAAAGDPSIVFTDYIDVDTKAVLLQNARVFVFPSLYEGFGFPLLEAMAAGLPIVASDIPASREVAAEGALFFPAHDALGLTEQLSRLTRDTLLNDSLRVQQKNILARYSWKRCAEETWRLLIRSNSICG